MTGKIKLPHASGNSMSIAAPATNPASDLELKLPATIGSANQLLKNSGTAGTLEFSSLVEDSSGNVGIGSTSPSAKLDVTGTSHFNVAEAEVDIKSTGSGSKHSLRLLNSDASANNKVGIYFGPANNVVGASIQGIAESDFTTTANRDGGLIFTTRSDGNWNERMRIDSTGNVFIGKTGEVSTQDGFQFKQTGECIIGRGSNDTVFIFQDINSSGATVGSISITSSNTAYNTSSDYRLKENITTSWDATTRLKQLKPSRFNFKVDKDKTVDGFIAHEVSSIVPEAITGEKDAVNEDGSVKPQGIDQSKLVPLLTKSLQEAIAEIETLKTKVAALEAT